MGYKYNYKRSFSKCFHVISAFFATEYNRILMFKEPISDKVLPGHVIRTEKVVNEGSCRAKCYLEPNCVAINVGPADEGGHICELKTFTDESSSHSALEDKKHYTHYSVEVSNYFAIANDDSVLAMISVML